jgi:hypothetical protein
MATRIKTAGQISRCAEAKTADGLAAPGAGKREDGGAEEPGRLDRVATAADGDGEGGGLDGDVAHLGALAEQVQDAAGEPGIGLEVAVEDILGAGQRQQGVKEDDERGELGPEKKDGRLGGPP